MNDKIRNAPLITVKAIAPTFLEQLYHTRGESDLIPDKLAPTERAIGLLVGGGSVIIQDTTTLKIRLAWSYRYCLGQGMDPKTGNQRDYLDKLDQIFVG